jgi:hypothetical protein
MNSPLGLAEVTQLAGLVVAGSDPGPPINKIPPNQGFPAFRRSDAGRWKGTEGRQKSRTGAESPALFPHCSPSVHAVAQLCRAAVAKLIRKANTPSNPSWFWVLIPPRPP